MSIAVGSKQGADERGSAQGGGIAAAFTTPPVPGVTHHGSWCHLLILGRGIGKRVASYIPGSYVLKLTFFISVGGPSFPSIPLVPGIMTHAESKDFLLFLPGPGY